MSPSSRSALRAVLPVLVLFIVAGCAAPSPTNPAAPSSTAPAAVARASATAAPAVPTASPSTPAQNDGGASQTSASTPAATAATSLTSEPTVSSATRAPQLPVASRKAPRFGPAWGARDIYAQGLVPSEQELVATELPGASEYRIDLAIDDSLTKVSGQEQVLYTNREDKPLSDIYVRLFPNALGGTMRVSDVAVDGQAATWEYKYDDTAVHIALPQPLNVGESIVLELAYSITVPQTLDKGYGLLSYSNGILALDTPYAPIPVYNEEGWNVETPPENADTSFNDASFYLVRLTAPSRLKLAVTGVEVERAEKDGNQVVTIAQGPGRDFYIAASPNYVVKTEQVGDIRINSYALPGEEQAQNIALDTTAKGIELFSKRFGPYPYSELDVAATPMLALGIEYPGTVGVAERMYEPDFKSSSGPAQVIIESTVAHELAHQWFYNLVGNDQVDQPWLDEAMAQYSVWLYYKDRDGSAAADAWKASWGSRWDRTEREKKPIGLPAEAYTDKEYGAIVYGRGPLFLSALADRMGQAKFDRFLKDYSTQYRWGIATTEDFKQLAAKECGCDLTDLYREWLDP